MRRVPIRYSDEELDRMSVDKLEGQFKERRQKIDQNRMEDSTEHPYTPAERTFIMDMYEAVTDLAFRFKSNSPLKDRPDDDIAVKYDGSISHALNSLMADLHDLYTAMIQRKK